MRRAAVLGLVLTGVAACAPASSPIPATPSYIVFFTPWSADLDAPAQGVIADAVRAAQAAPGRPVLVEGYATTIGSAQANATLSTLRAQHVSDGLVQAGVAASRITLRPRGAAVGNPDVENRRVVIEIGQ